MRADLTSATMYVAQDGEQGLLFHTLHPSTFRDNAATNLPRGLDQSRDYAVSMLGGGPLPAGVPARVRGAYWMGKGLLASVKGDFVGAAFVFDAVR